MLRTLKPLFILLLLKFQGFAQDKIAIGAAAMYNYPLNTKGFGIRSMIPVSNRLMVVPQVKYAPSFNETNKIQELYAGVNLNYMFIAPSRKMGYGESRIIPQKPAFYLTVGVAYNRWLNYQPTINTRAKENNILPEVGGGIIFGSLTTRIFIEGKYNALWNESYSELGVMFYPAFFKLNRKNACPKF